MLDVLEPLLFALLAVMLLGSGLVVVLADRITTSALFMAFAFLNMAGMFVLLGAETIAAFQVLIYVGAITVLILYGVMFTPQGARPYGLFFQRQTPVGALVAALAATSPASPRASSPTSRSPSRSLRCCCWPRWSGPSRW